MDQQVDGSGRHAEAISPPTSPPTRYTSPFSEMIDSSGPIAMEHHPESPHPTLDKKYPPPGSPQTDYSGLEAVEPFPPQYHQYGGPPPGSPPPQNMSPMYQPMGVNEKGQPVAHDQAVGTHSVDEPKILGLRKRTFYIALFGVIILIVLAVGLGAGLGIGLNKDDDDEKSTSNPFCESSPELCIGGSLDSKYFSQKGAFNGSGIALAGESWNKDQRRLFTLYFQHHTGDIRWMQYGTDQKWTGGGQAQVVATDAKDATPISAVAFALNETQYFHIFYISKDNTLKQMTQDNETSIWESGPLSDMNLQVYDNPTVGLQACWKGNFYGDSDASKFPTQTGETNEVPFDGDKGINIWFPSDATTFQQYTWYAGQKTWEKLNPWKGMNTHAGVGCYSWGTGTTTYAMMVNQDNVTEIWWKDTNTNLTSKADHPINSWVNASDAAIPNVYPATSLGYTNNFYMQMADKTIKGFNISYEAEKSSIVEDDTFQITDPAGAVYALGGSHLTCTSYAETKTENNKTTNVWDSLYVFVQTEGDDITAFTRPISGGQWTKGSLTIPDE